MAPDASPKIESSARRSEHRKRDEVKTAVEEMLAGTRHHVQPDNRFIAVAIRDRTSMRCSDNAASMPSVDNKITQSSTQNAGK